jgi:hypothetical protein
MSSGHVADTIDAPQMTQLRHAAEKMMQRSSRNDVEYVGEV